MVLNLPTSFAVSTGLHVVFLIFAIWGVGLFSPSLPPITEITLVSSSGSGLPEPGPAATQAKAGGQEGTSITKPVKAAARGQVVVATPDFVPVGDRPRRSGDRLMGANAGEGGGAMGARMGEGPAGGAGRKVRYQEPLEYPEWAKEKGLVAKVVLRFKVMPSGTVDSQIIVKRTSGYRKLDELAIRAMRNYLFEPLPPGTPQRPQWGEIALTFIAE